jgi:N-dimethylarginine dimethylaminohydrolase
VFATRVSVCQVLSIGEYEAAPRRVLVHDPAATHSFERLSGVPSSELERRFLFRAIPDRERFAREHAALVSVLQSVGVEVVYLHDVARREHLARLDQNPNHVYTRDSAITLPWLPGCFIRGAMRKPVRRHEPDVMASALSRLGQSEVLAMAPELFLEGGDVIPIAREGKRSLLVGFGPRTVRASLETLRDQLMPGALDELIGIELVAERMNLDGALVPVSSDTLLVEPTSIVQSWLIDQRGETSVDVIRLLADGGMQPIQVTRAEATTRQACNCVCLGQRKVVMYDLCERVTQALEGRQITVFTIPGAELIKGTGGPRCMTRPIYD